MATEAQITGTLAGGIPAPRRDSRVPNIIAPGTSQLLIGSDVSATMGQNMEQRRLAAADTGTIDFLSPPIVLSPGFGVILVCQTVNIAFIGYFKWRERPAFPAELG